MEYEIKENMAKLIAVKTKQIQMTADKYESLVKKEVHKIIAIEKSIEKLEKDTTLEEEFKKTRKLELQNEIKEIRKTMKKLNKEKYEALGCEINIGFCDDFNIKKDFI